MSDFVTIFTTASDVEARVVRGLLEAHGVMSFVSSEPRGVLPVSVGRFGEVRITVHAEEAVEARRIIDSHRTELKNGQVVRLRDEFETLQRTIGYRFRDRGLLEHAMTHTSRANEDVSGGVADNESMEFLGDALLGFVVADMLFRDFPRFDEGQKSKAKAAIVSTATLAKQAERLQLGEHLLLGRGEEKTGGRLKSALLADTYEALVAAIYLDGGLEPAATFLHRELKDAIDGGSERLFVQDYKSALQERVQALGRPLPEYRVSGESGPDHSKIFSVEVVVNGDVLGVAKGRAKKEAEQDAARQALVRLDETPRSA